ncbi:hypothetical protein LXL04_016730 [Taraxacum kok-saghyz]
MLPSHHGSIENSKYDSDLIGEGVSKEIRETYLVILVLIAAAAYQTALSPPGGYWQEDKIASLESNGACACASPPHNNSASPPASPPVASNSVSKSKSYTAGTSIIGTMKNELGYSLFVISNSIAFYSTIYMIFRFTVEFPLLFVMHSLLVLLSANYTTCVVMVLPPHYTYLRYICKGMPGLFLIPTIIMLIKRRRVLHYKFEW